MNIRRPLFAAAAGFVLGEGCAWWAESGNQQESIVIVGAALVLLGAAVRERKNQEKKQKDAWENPGDASAFVRFFGWIWKDCSGFPAG